VSINQQREGDVNPNPAPGLSDRELIQAVLAGDGRAERALYEAHVDRVFRLCYRLANGDHDRAQDFTQETFVRAFDRLSDFRGDAALATWLHSIAVSVSLNGMRKVKRWNERETALDDAPEIGAVERRAEPDLKSRLREAVGALPEHYRVVFVMYDMEGYTHDEIGAALDMPAGTSKARLSRARAKLRESLAQFAGEWAT
jgi:RNA polymerase sigma-70 factor, ECF subfamily